MSYLGYARETLENYGNLSDTDTDVLVNAVEDFTAEKVLDIGCGEGLEMIPFVRKRGSFCIGIDNGN
ncbi:MAG: hypothetical protein KIS76_11535 [Pyrinomonadaceae bacterium]|nr:hypothetical protein [Pyrinomonadaceae bacterium]